jgi:hypothetical protein
MNKAYKHLDAKLRIASLSLMQWCGVVIGVGLAIVWGAYLHPLSGMLNTVIAVYLGGIPAVAAWMCAMSEIDLPMRVRALIRWRRGEDLYVPGASEALVAYTLYEPVALPAAEATAIAPASPSLEALWES